ncbi:MAG: adenosylmethionine decarboxylase [Candidatus Bathyarchaeia archaeon]
MRLGIHIVADLLLCQGDVLKDDALIEKTLKKAAEEAGLQMIGITTHKFEPYGVSSVILIKESHISVHTWPEYGFAALDIFVCGGDPAKALKVIEEAFKPRQTTIIKIERGIDIGGRTSA